MSGGCRTPDLPRPAWRTRWALLRWEAGLQRRDPLTALYAMVFFLLAFGFTGGGVVELVHDRGDAPRSSPWALALAYGGLTAFAQVISTMIAVTAVLRDDAVRLLPVIATTGIAARDWFLGRLGAALVVAALVYLAIPAGALAGMLVSGATDAMPSAGAALWRVTRPFLVVTLPTMLVVTTLVACAAAHARRVIPPLVVALLLVLVWQGALAIASGGRDAVRMAGAVLDPFANAPVLHATREWTASEREQDAPPLDVLLLANRLGWLAIALATGFRTARRVVWIPRAALAPVTVRAPAGDQADAGRRASRGAVTELAAMTSAWITGDGGWRIIAALALLNATLNGVLRGGAGAVAQVLATVAEHSRVFLILLATIYAGELLWRERELRVAPLVDTLPVRTRDVALGRMLGLARAQLQVVAALAAGGLLAATAALWRLGESPGAWSAAVPVLAAWTVFVVWLPFVHLTALSLAVHALVRHKVLAHLLLIAGWTAAVILDGTLDRAGVTAWWLRFARPAALLGADGAIAWGTLAARAGYWSAVSDALVVLTAQRWPRGQPGRRG